MDEVSLEGEAVIEDGLGPDDDVAGSMTPKSEKKGAPLEGSDGGGLTPLSRTKSLGYLGGYLGGRIGPMVNSLKYADLSEKQKDEIKFPPRTFDYLRDDIRQNLIDLINFKVSREKAANRNELKVDESVQTYAIPHFKPPKAATARSLNDELKSEESTVKSETVAQNGVKRFESYLLVHNVAKRHNLGTLARSATAFGVTEIILVGRKDFNAFGSHGATLHLQFRHFHTLPEAVKFLKAKDVLICGVEITEGAAKVHKRPFSRSTAFVLGNEGSGLSDKEMEICDFFVYIPQYGPGTASLNVTVAASIVLHQFAVKTTLNPYISVKTWSFYETEDLNGHEKRDGWFLSALPPFGIHSTAAIGYAGPQNMWADFPERERDGQKFVVAERPVRRGPRNMCPDDPVEVAERRRIKAESATEDWLLCDTLYDASDDATDEAGLGGETE